MIIKVCGMRDADNIRSVERLAIDRMGFIFYPRSQRYVGNTDIEAISSCRKNKVGVFVNASTDEMLSVAQRYRLDSVQLHGDETPAVCRELTAQGYTVIKAFSIATADDLKRTADYETAAAYFLFDTKCEGYGGSGRRFDWSVLANYQGDTPFLLSGGITPDTADDILQFSHPQFAGIDLNSGFETAPGVKNLDALAEFTKKIRAFDKS
ncbi:MAG: phosphoribosylanthranilate isomerase [Tannerella sp.]|nr:phosphoribosylanthranilate isomerase [Tannerella sp.]